MRCIECGQSITHRAGSVEHGETRDFQHRASRLTPTSGVCEASPSGFHYPDGQRPTWLAQPIKRWDSLQAWAREVFIDADGFNAPIAFRRALTRLWSCYPDMPEGVCDPTYMANVIQAEMRTCSADSRLSTEGGEG